MAIDITANIVTLAVLFCLGTPLNLYACCLLWRGKWSSSQSAVYGWHVRRFQALQRCLNMADLFILFGYVPQQLISYVNFNHWTAGDFLCKVAAVFNVFGFHASSNCIVSIAWYRYQAAYSLLSPDTDEGAVKLGAHWLCQLVLPWIVAFVCSFPQIIVRKVIYLPDDQNVTAPVCATKWSDETPSDTTHLEARIYYLFHTLTIFWLPALAIIIIYIGTALCLRRVQKQQSAGLCFDTAHGTEPLAVHIKLSHFPTLLVAVYLLCWTPYMLVTHITEVEQYVYYLHHMTVLNTVLNPILYRFIRIKAPTILFRNESARSRMLLDDNIATRTVLEPENLSNSAEVLTPDGLNTEDCHQSSKKYLSTKL